MTTLERAAQAFEDALRDQDEASVVSHLGSSGLDCVCLDGNFFDLLAAMRAALAAIREPTKAMVKAAEDGDDPGSSIYGDPFEPLSHEEAWTAMIDAILEEKP